MNWFVVGLLIIFGLIALVLEILIVPGGIVGILGLLSIVGGVLVSYLTYGTTAGHITLIITLLVTIAGLIVAIRSRTWRRLMLNTQIDTKMNVFNTDKIVIGGTGKTISRLAPSGKAIFDGEIVEVTSAHNHFIDENSSVTIVKIEGYKIFVNSL